MAVARSSDGGRSYPGVTFFSFSGGNDHFNDKPMIASDTNASSPFRDNVYVAWDAATGGSSSGGVRLGRSTDHAGSFTVLRVDDPTGQGHSIAAVPFVGPNGELYVAWNDYGANTIAFNRSFDGGVTFGTPGVIAPKTLPFAIRLPAEFNRGALVYPNCDADRSSHRFNGRLYCAWMDLTPAGTTDLFLSTSDDQAATWSAPRRFASGLPSLIDRFGQWLSVDGVTGEVNISFYDTRNDTTGQRYMTDVYLARSTDGGASFAEVRVTTASSNEHDCNGVFPCAGINYSDQQGDYEGLVAWGGVAHPIWTDTRANLQPASGCSTGLLMEEVFTAAVK